MITVKTTLQDGYCSGSWLTFLTFLYSTHWQQSATLLECEEKHEGRLMSSPSTRLVHLSTYYCFIIKLFQLHVTIFKSKNKTFQAKKKLQSYQTVPPKRKSVWQILWYKQRGRSKQMAAIRRDYRSQNGHTHFTKCTLRCCAYLMWNKKKIINAELLVPEQHKGTSPNQAYQSAAVL